MSLPPPVCGTQRPGRGGCPRTSRASRTPDHVSAGDGARQFAAASEATIVCSSPDPEPVVPAISAGGPYLLSTPNGPSQDSPTTASADRPPARQRPAISAAAGGATSGTSGRPSVDPWHDQPRSRPPATAYTRDSRRRIQYRLHRIRHMADFGSAAGPYRPVGNEGAGPASDRRPEGPLQRQPRPGCDRDSAGSRSSTNAADLSAARSAADIQSVAFGVEFLVGSGDEPAHVGSDDETSPVNPGTAGRRSSADTTGADKAGSSHVEQGRKANVCVRCGGEVRLNRESYEIFERMHYVCFHYEFEHDPCDPDEECNAGGCPSFRRDAPPSQ
jgi:hypothetical protein